MLVGLHEQTYSKACFGRDIELFMREVQEIRHRLSSKVNLKVTASVPASVHASVPDGRVQGDEASLVEVQDADAVFMSGPDDIVRYHPNGITVAKGKTRETRCVLVLALRGITHGFTK